MAKDWGNRSIGGKVFSVNQGEKDYYLARGLTGRWGVVASPEKIRTLRKYIIGSSILDVGCANGMYASYLAQQGKRAVGVDYVLELLPTSREWHSDEKYVNASILNLPFADRQFDTVIAFDILEHVDDHAALQELRRTARQRVIARVPLTEPPMLANTGLIFYHHEDKTHLRTYTLDSIRSLLLEMGLREVVIEPVGTVNVFLLFLRYFRFPIFRGMLGGLYRFAHWIGIPDLNADCIFVADTEY